MELITVIVPVYNVEQYLERCIESIRNQTYTNLEIILVDDGSPDRCPQICDELVKQDRRIRVIHKKNEGLGFARNSGLEKATGVYVTFIDSDDWISHDHIENLHQAIKSAKADVAIGSHISVDINGIEHRHSASLQMRVYNNKEISSLVLLPLIGTEVDNSNDVQVNASSCMNLYRMEIIKSNRIQFMSEKYVVGEDAYFNIDFLYHAERLIVTDENGYYYFENTSSISRKYDSKRFARTLNFYTVLAERVEMYGLKDRVHFRIERSFLMKIRVAMRLIVLSDMPRNQKRQELKTILNNDVVQTVLQKYPIETYVPAIRLLSELMRRKNVCGTLCLIWFREKAKQHRFLSKAAKKIGIGK